MVNAVLASREKWKPRGWLASPGKVLEAKLKLWRLALKRNVAFAPLEMERRTRGAEKVAWQRRGEAAGLPRVRGVQAERRERRA